MCREKSRPVQDLQVAGGQSSASDLISARSPTPRPAPSKKFQTSASTYLSSYYKRLVATIPGPVSFGERESLVERASVRHQGAITCTPIVSISGRQVEEKVRVARCFLAKEAGQQSSLDPPGDGSMHSGRGQKDTPAIPNRVADPVGTWVMGKTSGICVHSILFL